MKKNAVTLMELLIVIVIIGILAAIAVPIYTGKVERTRGERAIANIELIKDAYRMYIQKNTNFTPFTLDRLSDINPIVNTVNTTFNLDLTDSYFTYNPVNVSISSLSITATGTGTIIYTYNASTGAETWGGSWPWLP